MNTLKRITVSGLLSLMALFLFTVGSTAHAAAQYYTTNPGIIKTKHSLVLYKDAAKTHQAAKVSAGHFAKITKVVKQDGKAPVLKTNTGKYVTANKAFVQKTRGYQNPKSTTRFNIIKLNHTGKLATPLSATMKVSRPGTLCAKWGPMPVMTNIIRQPIMQSKTSNVAII